MEKAEQIFHAIQSLIAENYQDELQPYNAFGLGEIEQQLTAPEDVDDLGILDPSVVLQASTHYLVIISAVIHLAEVFGKAKKANKKPDETEVEKEARELGRLGVAGKVITEIEVIAKEASEMMK